jgi:hypothetical protein
MLKLGQETADAVGERARRLHREVEGAISAARLRECAEERTMDGQGRNVVRAEGHPLTGCKPLRQGVGPLLGLALLIGTVALAASAFEYLTVDQYLVSTDDGDVTTDRQGRSYVIARLSPSQMTYVAIGQPVTIEARALGPVHFYGYVTGIAPVDEDRTRQPSAHRIAVRIDLRESRLPPDLRSGMSVRSTVYTGLIDTELLTPTKPNEKAANAARAKSMLLDPHRRAVHVTQSI